MSLDNHVLKNGAGPVLALWAGEIPFLFLGSFLLESFFGLPGLGGLTVEAVRNSDFAVIRAVSTLVAMMFVLGTAVGDIVQLTLDRRLRP